MKRVWTVLKVVGGVLASLIALFVGLIVWTFSGASPIVDGATLRPGVTVVKDSIVSAFLLDAGDGQFALIDSGQDAAGVPILAALRAKGHGPEAVKAIFFTHGHGDHIGGAHLFRSAKLYCLDAEEDLVEGRVAAGSPVGRLAGVIHTGLDAEPLHDGQTVQVGSLAVRVYALPGHTQGSAAYLARGVLFMGDSADASSDGRVRPAKWVFSDSQPQNVEALRALSARLAREHAEVQVIAFAHSGPLDGLAPLEAFAAAN